jgi:hypothetical protein
VIRFINYDIGDRVSATIVASGYASRGTGSDSSAHYPDFTENFFVWFLFLLGIVIVAYDSIRRRSKNK